MLPASRIEAPRPDTIDGPESTSPAKLMRPVATRQDPSVDPAAESLPIIPVRVREEAPREEPTPRPALEPKPELEPRPVRTEAPSAAPEEPKSPSAAAPE
jgi:hypothetical protein